MRSPPVAVLAASLAFLLAAALAPAARADWLQPDDSFREALLNLRLAARDTAGFATHPARLDTLGVALLRLGRFAEAERVFRRVLDLAPADDAARAGLGKLALFRDDLAAAESLLVAPAATDALAQADLLAARVRAGRYAEAADLSEAAGQPGRADLLRRMAEAPPYTIVSGPQEGEAFFVRDWPVPLVKVRLNGESVLMAVDTGASDLLVDDATVRRARVSLMPAQSMTFWSGARVAVRNAWVQRLEIAGFRIEDLPAGNLNLRRWSLEVNPQGDRVAGVIGLNLLRRFVPTLDFARRRLVLRRPGTAPSYAPSSVREPFEMWGESELTVWGSVAGGRRMAMVVQSGIPGCGLGAPREVFDELGIKSGPVARALQGAGAWLQGPAWLPVTVPAVNVGRVAADRLPGWVGALDRAELWRHGVRRDAVLSHAFFRGRRVTIDWSARELVFEEP
jgi:hypothetical protein